MVDLKLLQAWFFLSLLVGLGSPVEAQPDGSSEDSGRLFQQTPESPVALIESAEIAARLNRLLHKTVGRIARTGIVQQLDNRVRLATLFLGFWWVRRFVFPVVMTHA